MSQQNTFNDVLPGKMLTLRSETEIIQTWVRATQPLVSICCITYNHANFIDETMQSFLEQKTNFPIEILVHDDASTDGTKDILGKYQNAYPNIIKTKIQTINQYSMHPIIAPRFLYPVAKGKYIAMCEGDDYWTDEYKLQKQSDFLEKNSEFSMYAHAVEAVNNTKNKRPFYPTLEWDKKINDFPDVLNNHFIPTPSIMFRNDLDDFPFSGDGSIGLIAGDMAIELFMVSKGLCYYDTTKMGVYRNHDDGVTKKVNNNYEQIIRHWGHLYNSINIYNNFKYKKIINRKLSQIHMQYALIYIDEKEYSKSMPLFRKSLYLDFGVFFTSIYKQIVLRVKDKFFN